MRASIAVRVAEADESFRRATLDDRDGLLGRYFSIDRRSGWWWHRRPASGPLADYLAAGD